MDNIFFSIKGKVKLNLEINLIFMLIVDDCDLIFLLINGCGIFLKWGENFNRILVRVIYARW